jgi:16S rRNA (cytosine967-C5)-methyltransferase
MALLKIVSGKNPREIAAEVLGLRERGEFVETLLGRILADSPLSAADRGLCQELVYGTVRWQAALDWLIARKTVGRTQKKGLQNLLRLGLYQIFWLERIPDHAAVNETVELARRGGFGHQSGFVNAVLRGYLREAEQTRQALADLKQTQPHLGYSHPEWLVARWQQRWGAEQAAALMTWNNTPAKTFARVNTLKIDPGALIEQWRAENVEYDFVRRDWLPENQVFELKAHPPLAELESFQRGFFYVQDPSTLLAVTELAPRPGEAVLDLCAAPGGKLCYIAQMMQNQGTLAAYDTAPERLKLVEENCTRLGADCVRLVSSGGAVTQDGSRPELGLPGAPGRAQFQRVLVDAPCSNTGVMRRRVDLRWRIRPEEIERLRKAQVNLLHLAADHLLPGGELVYSTCSLEPEENSGSVTEFLSTRADFVVRAQRELLPFEDGVDGAFIARMQRR